MAKRTSRKLRKPRPLYLVSLRRAAPLTQAALAAISGVSQERISRLERDRDAAPHDRTVARLAVALGVPPALLRFGPNPLATATRRATTRPAVRKRRGRLFNLPITEAADR